MADKVRNLRALLYGEDRGAGKTLTDVSNKAENAGTVFERFGNGIKKHLTSRLEEMGPTGQKAAGALEKVSGTGIAAGAAIGGAGLAIGAVASVIKESIGSFVDYADQVIKVQRATGATAEDSSKLTAEFNALGVDTDAAAGAMFKFSRNIETAPGKLAAFGVEIAKTNTGATDVAGTLLNVADAYQRTEDPGKRAALVMAAFGKSGKDMIPVLEASRQQLLELADDAKRNHEILTQKQIDQVKQFHVAMREAKAELESFERGLGRQLIGQLADTVSGFNEVVQKVQDLTHSLGPAGHALGEVASIAEKVANPLQLLGHHSHKAAEAQQEAADKATALEKSLKDQADAAKESAQALDDLRQATAAAYRADIAYQRSLTGTEDAQKAYTDAVKANTAAHGKDQTASEALNKATLDLKSAYLDEADAAVALAEKTAASHGATLSAADGDAVRRGELEKLRDTLAPGSPLRTYLDGYINTLNTTPSVITTVMRLDYQQTGAAAVQQQGGQVVGVAGPSGGRQLARAEGGPVTAGTLYRVNEQGEESFVPAVNGTILTASQTAAAWQAPSAAHAPAAVAGTNLHVHVNLTINGPVVDGRAALERWLRQDVMPIVKDDLVRNARNGNVLPIKIA